MSIVWLRTLLLATSPLLLLPVLGQNSSVLAARGSFQVVGAGSQVRPFIALVTDAGGRPLAGVTVNFTSTSQSGAFTTSAGGTSQTATAVSDVQGLAEAPAFTAGPIAGQYQVQASSGNSSALFTITITPNIQISLAVNPANASFYGENVVLQATLTPSPGGGKVAFYDGVALLGYGQVGGGGVATLQTILPNAGLRHLAARYVANPFSPAARVTGFSFGVRALPVKSYSPPVFSIPAIPTAVVAADFNRDGKEDLAVATGGNVVQIYLGNGDGTFRASTAATFVGASTIARLWAVDVNADGTLDLIATDGVKSTYVATADASGNFTLLFVSGTASQPNVANSVADFDGDGYVDFVNQNGLTYYGDGNGFFGALGAPNSTLPVFSQTGYSVPVDINVDGVPDIAQSSFSGINFFRGTGSGRFASNTSFPVSSTFVTSDDLNGGGYYQVIGAISGGSGIIDINGPGGNYASTTYNTPGAVNGVTLIDLNGDGILDVLTTLSLQGGSFGAYVLYGNSDGTLQPAVALPGVLNSQSAIAADFNGDGIPDLAVTTPNGLVIQLGGNAGALSVYTSNSTNTLPTATLGRPYFAGITAAGGTRPVTLAVTSGQAPPGLSLIGYRTGSGADLTGTPNTSGTYQFTVTGTDALGRTSATTFSLNVANSPLIFGTQSLPNGVLGQGYQYTFSVSGGIGAVTFTYPNSSPPAGLTFNSNGTITGTPQQTGLFNFNVTATDSGNQTVSQAVTLLVTASSSNLPGRNPGIFRFGIWYIDINGDDLWTSPPDLGFVFGQTGDIPILGDWTNTGIQRYGLFRNGLWFLDINGDRTWTSLQDVAFNFGQTGDIPLIGDWDNTGVQRVGIFRNGNWYLDINNDRQWTSPQDIAFTFGQAGDIPVIGDWDNTGVQRIGLFRNGNWYLDINNDHQFTLPQDTAFTFGQAGDIPLVGDWTGTGQTRLGLFRNGVWFLDLNGDHTFTQGIDIAFIFGQTGDVPVLKKAPF